MQNNLALRNSVGIFARGLFKEKATKRNLVIFKLLQELQQDLLFYCPQTLTTYLTPTFQPPFTQYCCCIISCCQCWAIFLVQLLPLLLFAVAIVVALFACFLCYFQLNGHKNKLPFFTLKLFGIHFILVAFYLRPKCKITAKTIL